MTVYLDHNATSPARPGVAEAMTAALGIGGNPSSVHGFGRRARRAVEDARDEVARLINAKPETIVFTGSGSEANALALKGVECKRIIVSAIEHDSVLHNADAELLPANGDGLVDLAALEAMLAADARRTLVSVMHANNETGVIQPAAEAAAIAHRFGALFHCDAVQSAGKITVDVAALGCDLLSISAHKLGGPQGVGALYVAPHVLLDAMIKGGGQERGRRAGTENVSGIAGFGFAAKLARENPVDDAKMARLRDGLEQRIKRMAPEAIVFGAAAPRLANTSLIAMPGVSSEIQVMAFDLAGIAISAGAACSSGKVEPSHVLLAMGADEKLAHSAVRASLGWTNSEEDIDRFVETWSGLYAMRRVPAAAPAA
jgi:cysteine desulfurase